MKNPLLILVSTLILSNGCQAADYDVVILNGRVIDPETEFDSVRNVGILDGIIVKITSQPINGTETIDATGMITTAGFIDVENHGLSPFGIKLQLLDGATTQMDVEGGALNIAEWYSARKGKVQANYGTTSGAGTSEDACPRWNDAARSKYF